MPNALFHSYTKHKDLRFMRFFTIFCLVITNNGFGRRSGLPALGIFLVVLLLSIPLAAQWSQVSPSALLGKQSTEMGAITHKSGITWAGSLKVLYMSPDSGMTWISRSAGVLGNDYLNDICFYDNKIGLVTTHNGNVYRTDDQGITWREILRATGPASAAFIGSSDNIIVVNGAGNTINVTRDGGNSWLPAQKPWLNGGRVQQVRPLLGGSALLLSGESLALGNHIFRTNDYGATWQMMAGITDFDSYSFDVNPCNPSILYVINEEGTSFIDNISKVSTSTDGGNTFQISQSFPIDRAKGILHFNGAIALTTKAVFVQTVADGIKRSTDQGASWNLIGGPSATFDTRMLCAINSNIVLAADNNGTIYRTINSGGDSILNIAPYESLAISPNELFTFDTLVSCDSPVVRKINLHGVLCNPLKIIGQNIIGADAPDYGIVQPIGTFLTGDDSALISFRPHGSGARRGEFIITLEDSTRIAIPLKGYGRNIVFVEPKTKDISVDTIGGFAQVPILFTGFLQKEDLEVIIHYDSRMTYNNSQSLSGTSFDITGERWPGRAKINIPKSEMSLDTVTGIAIFTVFPDNEDCFKVSFDSLTILSPSAPCTYSIGNPVEASVCPLKGCGVMTLTNYILHGETPQLFVQPNPNHGTVSLTSTVALTDATIEIIDMLGRISVRKNITLKKGDASKIDLDNVRDGSYSIRVRTGGLLFQLPIVVIR